MLKVHGDKVVKVVDFFQSYLKWYTVSFLVVLLVFLQDPLSEFYSLCQVLSHSVITEVLGSSHLHIPLDNFLKHAVNFFLQRKAVYCYLLVRLVC